MVIRSPLKVVVCLGIIALFVNSSAGWGYTGPDISGDRAVQGEALSADPLRKPSQTLRTGTGTATRSHPSHTSQPSRYRSAPTSSGSTSKSSSSSSTSHSSASSRAHVRAWNPSPRTYGYAHASTSPLMVPPQAVTGTGQPVCPPTGCAPSHAAGPSAGPLLGLFSPLGLSFGPYECGPLPRPGCKQFHVNAKLWYAKLNASTIVWGTNTIGGQGTELDLHNDLGLRIHEYIPEYEVRCQLRPRWGVRYSFMPIRQRDNVVPLTPFFFGSAFYPAGISVLTTWDRYIHRWDLVYDWFQCDHAVSSLSLGYSLYDDKLQVSNFVQSRTRSRGFGLAIAGASIEKVVRNLKSGTVSLNCKWNVSFLEGYFGLDGYAAGRVAVNMDCGRFGYLEAGWRWIMLERNYPSNADKTSLDGLSAAAGLVF